MIHEEPVPCGVRFVSNRGMCITLPDASPYLYLSVDKISVKLNLMQIHELIDMLGLCSQHLRKEVFGAKD